MGLRPAAPRTLPITAMSGLKIFEEWRPARRRPAGRHRPVAAAERPPVRNTAARQASSPGPLPALRQAPQGGSPVPPAAGRYCCRRASNSWRRRATSSRMRWTSACCSCAPAGAGTTRASPRPNTQGTKSRVMRPCRGETWTLRSPAIGGSCLTGPGDYSHGTGDGAGAAALTGWPQQHRRALVSGESGRSAAGGAAAEPQPQGHVGRPAHLRVGAGPLPERGGWREDDLRLLRSRAGGLARASPHTPGTHGTPGRGEPAHSGDTGRGPLAGVLTGQRAQVGLAPVARHAARTLGARAPCRSPT